VYSPFISEVSQLLVMHPIMSSHLVIDKDDDITASFPLWLLISNVFCFLSMDTYTIFIYANCCTLVLREYLCMQMMFECLQSKTAGVARLLAVAVSPSDFNH